MSREWARGEDPDDVGAPLDLLVDPLERVRRPDLAPVGSGERVNAQCRSAASRSMSLDGGELGPSIRRPRRAARRQRWRRAERRSCGSRRRPSPSALGHVGEHVAHEMDPAPLPGRADQHLGDRGPQPVVGVGDHQAHPSQASLAQRAQELGPEALVLAVADRDAEDLTVTVGGDTGGHDDRLDTTRAPSRALM